MSLFKALVLVFRKTAKKKNTVGDYISSVTNDIDFDLNTKKYINPDNKTISSQSENKSEDLIDDYISSVMTDIDFNLKIKKYISSDGKAISHQPEKWYSFNEQVSIKGYDIPGGLIYVGESTSENYYDVDASLINPSLTVCNAKSWEHSELMGYWPSYHRIHEKCRGAYLDWLATGRSEPEANIGYVFLFFYGLERRLLIDDQKGLVSEQERTLIINEIRRLLEIYGDNRSFRGYATNLLATIWVLYQRNTKLPDYIDINDRFCSKPFEVLLARYVAAEKPLPAGVALQWLTIHPDFSLKTPARRCAKEFKVLFLNYYKNKFGEGIKIPRNKKLLKLHYNSASPSIPKDIVFPELNLPDPFNLKEPLKKIYDLAELCSEELESYSRYLGKKDNNPLSLAALSLLPKEIINRFNGVDIIKERLSSLCESSTHKITKINDLYKMIGQKIPDKLSKKEQEALAIFLDKLGFGIAPDIRYYNINLNDSLTVFQHGHGIDFTPSEEFKLISTVVRLGSIVAQADKKISVSEEKLLHELINDNRNLTGIEKDSLLAFSYWCLNVSQSVTGLKQRISLLDGENKKLIRSILISLAHADGFISPDEIKQLEKLYLMLGFDKNNVIGDIHVSSSNDDLVTVSTKDPDASFKIPSPPIINNKEESKLKLNDELVKLRMKETQQVKSVLESIFADDKIDNEEEVKDKIIIINNNGLDDNHQKLLNYILTKETWERSALHYFCKELDLMLDGAMEVINEWAFENANSPLIEDGDPIFVDVVLAKEILDAK